MGSKSRAAWGLQADVVVDLDVRRELAVAVRDVHASTAGTSARPTRVWARPTSLDMGLGGLTQPSASRAQRKGHEAAEFDRVAPL